VGTLKCCGHCNAAIWIDFRGECSGDGMIRQYLHRGVTYP
jgi:hypothetical protein